MNHELWQCNTIYAYRNRYELRIRLTKFSSTSVENPLQIDLFMQNKPNLLDTQMNVSNSNTMTYKKANLALSEVEWANSNPNKPNFKKAKMNVNLILTKDYRKKDNFTVRINKPNFVKGQK